MDRHRKPWTKEEDDFLAVQWGQMDLPLLGRALGGRTEDAVSQRAKRLGLGSPSENQGTITLRALAREIGYEPRTILRVAERLGFLQNGTERDINARTRLRSGAIVPLELSRLIRVSRSDPRQTSHRSRSRGRWAIYPEQRRAIVAFLEEQPSWRVYAKTTGPRTTRGVWGIGNKPAACLGHGLPDRPHYAKGLCARCYLAALRRRLDGKAQEG
jgi:hypothetical protein